MSLRETIAAPRPNRDPLSSNGSPEVGEVVNALRRIVRALHRSHRIAEHRWRVSSAQLLVLQRLAELPSASVNDLAMRTFTHQSTVSVVVSRLVRRGLVRSVRANDDGRRAELSLTPAGRTLLNRALGVAQTRLIDALERIPPARLRTMASCLESVVEEIAEDEPAALFFEQDGNGNSPPRAVLRQRPAARAVLSRPAR